MTKFERLSHLHSNDLTVSNMIYLKAYERLLNGDAAEQIRGDLMKEFNLDSFAVSLMVNDAALDIQLLDYTINQLNGIKNIGRLYYIDNYNNFIQSVYHADHALYLFGDLVRKLETTDGVFQMFETEDELNNLIAVCKEIIHKVNTNLMAY